MEEKVERRGERFGKAESVKGGRTQMMWHLASQGRQEGFLPYRGVLTGTTKRKSRRLRTSNVC